MKILLSSGGSNEIIKTRSRPADTWVELKGQVLRLLKGRKQERSFKVLSLVNFELCDGTNGFDDEFQYLHSALRLDRYVSICSKEGDSGFCAALKSIKDTFEELSDLNIRFIAVSLKGKESTISSIDLPHIENADQTLKTAIEEFRASIQSEKYLPCVDRLHTAFHAFLKKKALDSGCTLTGNEGVTKIYSMLRQSRDLSESPSVDKILKMIATIVNEFNEVRNHNSLAHPNQELLSEDDALFVVNCISAVFHFLNAKL
jgi:hypothetical protein